MKYEFYAPTRVLFGAGKLGELHGQKLPGKKALLMISNGKSTRTNGYLARCEEQLKKGGVAWVLFDGIEPNPTRKSAMAGAAAARDGKCDFIVALGGGSVMDAAKAVAMMATNPGDLWDYVEGGSGKGLPLTQPPLPIVAITTTAGTGSEVDQWGVITHEERQEKIGVGGPDSLFPVLAIVDPELMVTVPPAFTAYQGFDALFHSTETYINKDANLMSDMVALSAIRHIAKYLPEAVRNGSDLEARTHMAFANTVSGYSMVVGGCTSEHSLEHALSAYHPELPHGAGLIMISLGYYQTFIDRKVCDERFVEMAKALGMPEAQKAQDFIVALSRLQKACGVSELKMSDYGIRREEIPSLADNAKRTMGGLFSRDRTQLTNHDCETIYERSYR